MRAVAEIESALEQLHTEQMLDLELDGAEQAELREALDDSLARRHEAFTPLDAL